MDIEKLSKHFCLKKLDEKDLPQVLQLCQSQPLYYDHCPPKPSLATLRQDLQAIPPGKENAPQDKFYLGFFKGDSLVAVADLILHCPKETSAFLGFFMVFGPLSSKGLGRRILAELMDALSEEGFESLRLAYMIHNPQAKHFWKQTMAFESTGITTHNGQGEVEILEKRFNP